MYFPCFSYLLVIPMDSYPEWRLVLGCNKISFVNPNLTKIGQEIYAIATCLFILVYRPDLGQNLVLLTMLSEADHLKFRVPCPSI